MDKQPIEPEAVRQLRAAFAVLTVARDACQAFTGDMEPREWQEWWSEIRPVIERALASAQSSTGGQSSMHQVEAAMTTLRNAMDTLATWQGDFDPETRARLAPLVAKIVSQAIDQATRATRQASLVPASGGDRTLKVIEELHHALRALARIGDDLPAARKDRIEADIWRAIDRLRQEQGDDEEDGDVVTTR